MKKEDIEFLLEFANEIKTQDNFSTAKPVYWGIKDREKFYGNELIDPDGLEFIDEGEETNKELILSKLYENAEETINWDIIESENEFMECEDKLLLSIFFKRNDLDIEIIEYKYQPVILTNLMFLTYDSAKRHLELNYYHYTEWAHPYCMHAWRNPKLEKFMNIIENIEKEDLKESSNE